MRHSNKNMHHHGEKFGLFGERNMDKTEFVRSAWRNTSYSKLRTYSEFNFHIFIILIG